MLTIVLLPDFEASIVETSENYFLEIRQKVQYLDCYRVLKLAIELFHHDIAYSSKNLKNTGKPECLLRDH